MLGYRDDLMKKRTLSELVLQSYRHAGLRETVDFLDRLSKLSEEVSTYGCMPILSYEAEEESP